MGLFTRFKRKKATATTTKDEDETDLDKQIRQMRRQRKLQEEQFLLAEQKAEYEDLIDDLYGTDEDGESPDNLLTSMLMKVLDIDKIKNSLTSSVAPSLVTNPTEKAQERGAALTSSQLEGFWNNLSSKQKKIIKRMNDDSLRKAIKLELSDRSEEDQEQAFIFVRAQ